MGFELIFAGFSGWSLILFVVGLALLVAEMFMPGFGFIGLSGLVILIVDVVISAKSLSHGLMLGGILILILLALFFLFLWLGAKGKLPKRLILKSKEDVQSGYVAADFSQYLGESGITVSKLRPAGIVRVNNQNIDVVSEGEFIEKGVSVYIKRVEGNRIVVDQLADNIPSA